MMWKLLTGIMGEKLCHHLERNGLFKDEQKGCRKGSAAYRQGNPEELPQKVDKFINGLY